MDSATRLGVLLSVLLAGACASPRSICGSVRLSHCCTPTRPADAARVRLVCGEAGAESASATSGPGGRFQLLLPGEARPECRLEAKQQGYVVGRRPLSALVPEPPGPGCNHPVEFILQPVAGAQPLEGGPR